ncbi:MAG: hypothetical protein JO161_00710 [Planctomycetaceae bacterium]|nr:hypothetical protein [Planctomycetaceae bacterium]
MLKTARDQCAIFRRIRHKRLAHNDLKSALGLQAEDAGPMLASRQDVENALAAIRRLMNAVQGHYQGGETGYEHVIPGAADGETLIHYLQELRERREKTPYYRS